MIIEDWDNVKKRWQAWWQRELYDRVVLQVRARKNNTQPHLKQIINPEQKTKNFEKIWTDIDYLINFSLMQYWNSDLKHIFSPNGVYFGGEAIPIFWHNWSIGNAVIFGAEPLFKEETMWVKPLPVQENGYPKIEFNENNYWWQWFIKSTNEAAVKSKGRYMVLPLWGNHAGDTLALIRDPQKLMLDLIDNPIWVKKSVKYISDCIINFSKILWELIPLTGVEGTIDYTGCWSPKKTMAFDCDISAMVSPETFKTVFLPPLIEAMHKVDHRIYHLDGIGALQHLDTLLDLPELHAIQWVPGAGHTEILQWIPLIKKIQSKNKNLVLFARADEVFTLLKEVEPEGLCIDVRVETEDEARTLISQVSNLF